MSQGSAGAPVVLRLFGKPKTLKNRHMGVALAGAPTLEQALKTAKAAAAAVQIRYRA